MDFEPFDFFFLELQEVQSKIPKVVQSLKLVQAVALAFYTASHNTFMQVIFIEAEKAFDSNDHLKIPDPYTWLLSKQDKSTKQKIFLPLYYLELKKNILKDYLSYVKDKDISLKDRDMTLFENALKRPLSTQLAKQNVFLYNEFEKENGDLRKNMPLFLLSNLEALLKALETIVMNREYASFGLNQMGTRKFNSYRLYDLEKERTNNLISLIRYIIPQVHTTWKIDEKELDDFQTEYHELFCYDTADILPLTYITSSYLSTMRGFISESIWKPDPDPFINSVWQWD